MSEFRNVSAHAQPLASGRLVAPGDTASFEPPDPESKALDPHDQALIDDGAFVPVDTAKPKKTAEKEA